MGNGVSGDQGNLPSYGKRDVGVTFDRKQHDWSEQARAPEVNTLESNANSYSTIICGFSQTCVSFDTTFRPSTGNQSQDAQYRPIVFSKLISYTC